uniref:Uncharacterized protein n=1 Tax=Elaeophora elaphi TaxID=1147741 RepID=A0A0R3RH89_9BILA
MMDREALEDESAIDEPSYFCYKAYVKMGGYAIFILYSAIGIKRLYEHANQLMILDRCTSCQLYQEGTAGILWGVSELFLYGLAPLSALFALIYADLEWLFPTYAVRTLFPSYMLVLPILFTIFSYILYWLIDLIIDVQQVSDNLLDMEVWKGCIWASAMLITNIYAVLLAIVVLQLIYYQHYIVIEEQVIREQQNVLNDERARFPRPRRQLRREFFNQPPNVRIQQNQEELNNNLANIGDV